MRDNLKKMISFYRPYRKIFWADLFFAMLSAGIALVLPLVVRYVTYTLAYRTKEEILSEIIGIALILLLLVAVKQAQLI